MSEPPLPKDPKNFYHPSTEQEIIDMVTYANQNSLQLRVRGSAHSFGCNIYTDVCTLDRIDVNASAPDGDNINLMLDKYASIEHVEGSLVTVQAGIHLGHDPNDPLSTPENSLLHQLHHTYGLALDDLGGITHQTVSGFLSTGSSGGSTTYSVKENVHALRIVDGTGQAYEVSRDDPDKRLFHAALVSLGLLGVLSKVTFNCTPRFNIKGVQISSAVHTSHVDIYDDNPTDPKRKGLTTFLTETPYTRIMWWPQTSKVANFEHERLQVWQAERCEHSDDFEREPFKLFENSEIMMLYSFLMTLMGNIEDMDAVRQIIAEKESQFKDLMKTELKDEHGLKPVQAKIITELINAINQIIFNLITGIGDQIPSQIRRALLPVFSAAAMNILTNLDNHIPFQDHAFLGLPMDNTADDTLVPTMFTEIWIPLSYATKATNAISDYFKGLLSLNRYSRTGSSAWELYSAKPTDAWMSMSYSDGTDDWKDGAFRIDPLWFIHNNDDYLDLYRPIWILLYEQKIPFRLHWGKIFPSMEDTKYNWRDIMVQSQYPRLAQFLEFRAQKDPNGIFLSSFWRYWLDVN